MKILSYIIVFILSIDVALTYGVITSTLSVYFFTELGLSLKTIGTLSLRMLPFSLGFIIAPFVDRFAIRYISKKIGQRKSWFIICQVNIIICMLLMSYADYYKNVTLIMILSFLIPMFATMAGIAMEGYRILLFNDTKEKGSIAGAYGFRVGLLFSSALLLYLSSIYPWYVIFLISAFSISIMSIAIMFGKNENDILKEDTPFSFKNDFLHSFYSLFSDKKFIYVFLVITLYKVTDGYIFPMIGPFLIEMGYSRAEISISSQTVSILTQIAGITLGKLMINKYSLWIMLFVAELLAALTNIFYISLIYYKSNVLLATVSLFEALADAMCNFTIYTYISYSCNNAKFPGTHFFMLNCLSNLFRTIISSTSGFVASAFSWKIFFIFSALLSIPSLLAVLIVVKSQRN